MYVDVNHWRIATKEVHVVFEDAGSVVSNAAWNLRRVARCLDESPSEVALHRVTARGIQLIRVEFTKALEVKLEK